MVLMISTSWYSCFWLTPVLECRLGTNDLFEENMAKMMGYHSHDCAIKDYDIYYWTLSIVFLDCML